VPRRDQPKIEFLKNLLKANAITLEAYQRLNKERELRAVEGILAVEEKIPEETLARARAAAYRLPFEDLAGRKVDPAVLKAFKAEGFDAITDRHYDVVRNLGHLLKIDLAKFQ